MEIIEIFDIISGILILILLLLGIIAGTKYIEERTEIHKKKIKLLEVKIINEEKKGERIK